MTHKITQDITRYAVVKENEEIEEKAIATT